MNPYEHDHNPLNADFHGGFCSACEWEVDDDLGDCPYLARYESIPGHDPLAMCAYGCTDEPQCVTCVPRGGWPKFHAIIAASQPASRPDEVDEGQP